MNKFLITLLISTCVMTSCNVFRQDSAEENALRMLVKYYEEIQRNIGPNEENYDPNIFALEASRGELKEEYFGIKLADLKKDSNGHFTMTDEQRQQFITNLLGTHDCSLQWISWKEFGKCTFSLEGDTLVCRGGQKIAGDYLEIDGTIEVINPLHLRFTGIIKTCISHIANGSEVVRKGTYNFKVKGKRAYWRMQEINNPIDGSADYVDIYFQ